MANTNEEILLTMNGKDNASQMFANVDKNAQSMASNISAAMSKVNTGLMNIGQVTDNMMQSLTGKSAMDNIFGTSSKAETNKVLLNNMTETKKGAEELYETVDKVTDSSLTSMQELIPAMKAFKSATGATDKEMINITDEIANFGAAVLAQTGSTDLAQQAMMDLSKGVKGAFASLDQYGISQAALERTGLWSGEEDDVEGFMKAVDKVTGSTKELMETNQGLDALIGKSFSRAGKKIGNEFLPIIKDVKRGFIELDDKAGGAIASTILLGSAGVEAGNRIAWNISTAVNGAKDLAEAFKYVTSAIKGAGKAAETTTDAINTASNISDIGAGAAGAAGALGKGAEVTKTASKGEKAIDAGTDALLMADMLKGTKSSKKDASKLLKELEESSKVQEKVQKEMDHISGLKFSTFRSGKVNGLTEVFEGIKPTKSGYTKVLADNLRSMLDGTNTIESVVKENKSARDKAGKALKELTSYDGLFDDDLLKEWEDSGQTLSGAIKGKIGSFTSKIGEAFGTLKNFNFKGLLTGPFDKLKGFFSEGLGTGLQNALMKGFSGLGNIASTIKGKITGFGSTLAGLKNIDIGGKIKGIFTGLDKSLYQSIKGFSFKNSLSSLKNAFSGLSGAKDIAKGAETVAEVTTSAAVAGEAAAAAAPAMEAGAAGGAAAAAGATGLSAAFTSMIVPLLALAAVIAIMIPVAALLAAEAMVVIKLLGEFMEALNFDSINLKGAIKGISQVATALAWVAAAMLALAAVNIATSLAMVTTLFTGILGPLDVAVKAIKEAGQKLSQFGSSGIDPSVASNIQSVATALGAVSQAMGALTWTNIVTGFSDFIAGALNFGSVTEGLEQAKNDIMEASTKLNEFSGMTTLDSGVAQNIQNVCNSLASVGDAMGALRSIRDGQNWDDIFSGLMNGLFGEGVDIQTALENVKQDIIDASVALAEFTGISEIPEGISEKIKKVADTLTSVNDAVNTIKNIVGSGFDNWVEGLFGGYDVAGGLEKIKTDLITASQKLAELNALSEIDEGITEKIQQVSTALQKVSEVSTTLVTLGDSGIGEFDPTMITTAITNVQTCATELAKLNEVAFDGAAADTILGAIQTTLENVKTTLAAASGFSEVSVSIGSQIISGVTTGLSPLAGTVQSQVSSAINSAGSQALAGGSMLGRAATEGMRSSLQLKSVMDTEVSYALQAITSREDEFYQAGVALGEAAKRGFESAKAINPGSPGNLAHTMMDEVGYILEAMKSKYSAAYDMAAGLGSAIFSGFGNPNLDIGMLSNGGSLTAEHIGALKTTISNAPDKVDSRPVTIIVGENAVNVDARNYTTKEAQGLMITALEGMDNITNVSVDVTNSVNEE